MSVCLTNGVVVVTATFRLQAASLHQANVDWMSSCLYSTRWIVIGLASRPVVGCSHRATRLRVLYKQLDIQSTFAWWRLAACSRNVAVTTTTPFMRQTDKCILYPFHEYEYLSPHILCFITFLWDGLLRATKGNSKVLCGWNVDLFCPFSPSFLVPVVSLESSCFRKHSSVQGKFINRTDSVSMKGHSFCSNYGQGVRLFRILFFKYLSLSGSQKHSDYPAAQ